MSGANFCTNCGNALQAGAKYCGSCGCPLRLDGSSKIDCSAPSAQQDCRDGGATCGDLELAREDPSHAIVSGSGKRVEKYDPKMTFGDHAKLWIPILAIFLAVAWFATTVGKKSSTSGKHGDSRQTESVRQLSVAGRWTGQSINGWPMTMRVYENGRYSLEMLSDLGANGEWSQEGRTIDFYQNGGMIFRGTLSTDGMRLSTVDAMRIRTGSWSRM